MSKIVEKYKLSRELKLPLLVQRFEMEQEAKILTEAKLKVTTPDEIRKTLRHGNGVLVEVFAWDDGKVYE